MAAKDDGGAVNDRAVNDLEMKKIAILSPNPLLAALRTRDSGLRTMGVPCPLFSIPTAAAKSAVGRREAPNRYPGPAA